MKYLNEHLFVGQLGHFFSVLSLVASLLATICFFKAHKEETKLQNTGWLRLARIAFAIETVAVIGIFISLYYIIAHHLFEYKYAWQHSSTNLEIKYLLSCFWEGQEGSFMLWSFWHCVLGWVVIWRGRKWEASVMFVVSFAQICLATMLIGIYFFGYKIGTSPFVLIRNEGIFSPTQTPFFYPEGILRADYVGFIKGQGLNALLQNYWMVIHPPILFLGFASTTIPFAFAIAGLMKKEVKTWTVPALPWALFSAAILGTGISMGAMWAYESLTFGGYWAWDPVENASLVPWLVLVGGIHTNLIFKSSGYSLRSTFFFYIISFLLVLYSTFLTRSGVLGDTSVHAFTDLGMNVQLFLFLGVFVWFAPLVAAKNAKQKIGLFSLFAALSVLGFWLPFCTLLVMLLGVGIFIYQINQQVPTIAKEEQTMSREFWMFIGSLVFFIAACVVIVQTSLPVFNKLFGATQKLAPPAEPEHAYNQYWVYISIILALLTACTQYLRYKNTPAKLFYKKIGIPTLVALVVAGFIIYFEKNVYTKQGLVFWYALQVATVAAVYSIVSNAGYIWIGVKGKLKLAGSSVAHIGFGMMLLGILISASNRTVLSINKTGMSPLKADDPKENALENTTLIKGVQTDMGLYDVTYTKDTLNPSDGKTYYEINFVAKQGDRRFNLYPDVIPNNKGGEGLTPNPDSKHYWNRDIFTYVTYLTDPEKRKNDTAQFQNKVVAIGDTVFYSNGFFIVNKLQLNPANSKYPFQPLDTAFVADVTVVSKDGRRYHASPGFILLNNRLQPLPDTVLSQSIIFTLNKLVDASTNQIEIGVKESNTLLDFITLKVYEFPHINILWIGIALMGVGFIMSVIRRVQLMKGKA